MNREEIRAACEAATEGPWTAYHGHNPQRWFIGGHHYGPDIDPSDVAEMRNDRRAPNAAFIALSRTAVPALLDALEAAERERDRAVELLRAYPGKPHSTARESAAFLQSLATGGGN